MTLSEELCERARSYQESGPSAAHTAELLYRAAGEINRLNATVQDAERRAREWRDAVAINIAKKSTSPF